MEYHTLWVAIKFKLIQGYKMNKWGQQDLYNTWLLYCSQVLLLFYVRMYVWLTLTVSRSQIRSDLYHHSIIIAIYERQNSRRPALFSLCIFRTFMYFLLKVKTELVVKTEKKVKNWKLAIYWKLIMDLHYHFLIYLSLCIISKLSAWVVMDIYDKQGPENERGRGKMAEGRMYNGDHYPSQGV